MSLPTLTTIQKLQMALHAKAKATTAAPRCPPNFRLYALYDKVYRKDVLWFALRRCRNNGGVPGVDDQTFADIDEYGEGKWLEELAEKKAYRAVDAHVTNRLRQWLRKKHKQSLSGYEEVPRPLSLRHARVS